MTAILDDGTTPLATTGAIDARLAGYTWGAVNDHLDTATDQALAAGYSQQEIDSHLGYQDPSALTAGLSAQAPEEPPPPSDTPARLDPFIPQAYADAMRTGQVAGPEDFSALLASSWGLDPQTEQQTAAQLPHPQDTIDHGIAIAHSAGVDDLAEGALNAHNNLLNIWAQTGALPSDAFRALLSDPLMLDAAATKDGILSPKMSAGQEAAEQLSTTHEEAAQGAGSTLWDWFKGVKLWEPPGTPGTATETPEEPGLGHTPIPLPSAWADPETLWNMGKSLYNLPSQALSYWDKVEADRREGKDVSEAWKDSPAFNAVADFLVFGAGQKGASLAAGFAKHPLIQDFLRNEDGSITIKYADGRKGTGETWESAARDAGRSEEEIKAALQAPPQPEITPAHIPDEVLDTMRAPSGLLDANKIAMAMGEKVKGEGEAAPSAEGEPQRSYLTSPEKLTPEQEAAVQAAHQEHTKAEVAAAVEESRNPPAPTPPPDPPKPPGYEDLPSARAAQDAWVKELDDRIRFIANSVPADEAAMMRMFKAQPKEWLDPAAQKKFFNESEARLGADDPSKVEISPETKAFLDAHADLFDEQHSLAMRQAELLRDQELPEEERARGLRTVHEGHVHRILVGEENLGHELNPNVNRDPITGITPQSRSLSSWDPGMQSRKNWVVLEDAQGNRIWGGTLEQVADQHEGAKYGDKITTGSGTYTLKPARTADIEANTPLRFRQNLLGATVQDVMTRRAVVRALEMIRDTKPRLQEQGLFRPEGAGATPPGWVKVDVPQFRGYAPERIARPLNNFYQNAWERGDLLPALVKMNHWLISSLFVSPIGHLRNEAAHFVPTAGWQMINPAGLARMLYYGRQAAHDVYTMSPRYEEFKRNDGALLGSATRTRNFTQLMWTKWLHEVAADEGGRWSQVAKYSGFGTLRNLIQWEWQNSNKILWNGGDILRQTLYLMRQNPDGIGWAPKRTMAEAIHDVNKGMPTYYIPSEVLRSGKLAEFFKNPLYQIFGRYRHGQISALYNDARDLAGPARTPQERFEAVGRVLAFGGMYSGMAKLGIYAGGATLAHAVYGLATGDKNWDQGLGSWWVVAPILKAMEFVRNNKDYFGHDLWVRGGNTLSNVIREAESVARQFPAGQLAMEMFQPGGALKVAEKLLGWDAPAEKDPAKVAAQQKREIAAAQSASRKDPVETAIRDLIGAPLPPALGRGGGSTDHSARDFAAGYQNNPNAIQLRVSRRQQLADQAFGAGEQPLGNPAFGGGGRAPRGGSPNPYFASDFRGTTPILRGSSRATAPLRAPRNFSPAARRAIAIRLRGRRGR